MRPYNFFPRFSAASISASVAGWWSMLLDSRTRPLSSVATSAPAVFEAQLALILTTQTPWFGHSRNIPNTLGAEAGAIFSETDRRWPSTLPSADALTSAFASAGHPTALKTNADRFIW